MRSVTCIMYQTTIIPVLNHKCFINEKHHFLFGNAIFGTYPFWVGSGGTLQRLKFTDLSF